MSFYEGPSFMKFVDILLMLRLKLSMISDQKAMTGLDLMQVVQMSRQHVLNIIHQL